VNAYVGMYIPIAGHAWMRVHVCVWECLSIAIAGRACREHDT